MFESNPKHPAVNGFNRDTGETIICDELLGFFFILLA
jgi:hypothetical protein